MSSAKQDSSVVHMTRLLRAWDRSPKERRRQLLQQFIDQHQDRSGPELESEMAHMASLFLARICVWTKLTYLTGTCLTELLQVLHIFLGASGSQDYLLEFLEHGGLLCLHELCLSTNGREIDKQWALKVLICIAKAGTKYKETICECYGIRAAGECMAKSKSEHTQETARVLLETLAVANPRFTDNVYKGLIGILPCHSPKAQQLALQTLRLLQQTRTTANRALIDRIIYLLESLHLEVQSAVIELIKDLMRFEVADDILSSLVALMRPQREIQLGKLIAAADMAEQEQSSSGESDDASDANDGFETRASRFNAPKSGRSSLSTTPKTSSLERGGGRGQQQQSQSVLTASAANNKTPAQPGSKLRKAASKRSTTVLSSRRGVGTSSASRDKKAAAISRDGSSTKPRRRGKRASAGSPVAPPVQLVFVQQAAAIKCLKILTEDSTSITMRLLKLGIISGLLYALGNLEHPESQRQASVALQYFCKFNVKVNKVVHEAMGPTLYSNFLNEPDSHYLQITPLQADILVSNKVSYLGDDIQV